ncbi:hypothetical protein BD410DRAFT_810214 [Rickenella mellea]|uniref:Uncharacterized protein n=1 Tax=Rickenella mellea TaxID=50990 RepID=A0A4Y7PFL2_9AGAM|nr:hypothetical protein BD410DRAFT_810214 [Rickenella mellea]
MQLAVEGKCQHWEEEEEEEELVVVGMDADRPQSRGYIDSVWFGGNLPPSFIPSFRISIDIWSGGQGNLIMGALAFGNWEMVKDGPVSSRQEDRNNWRFHRNGRILKLVNFRGKHPDVIFYTSVVPFSTSESCFEKTATAGQVDRNVWRKIGGVLPLASEALDLPLVSAS